MRRATLILCIVSLIFIIFVFYSLFHLEPLKVSGERLERSGQSVLVRGAVTNTGTNAQQAELKVQLFDAAGHRLAQQIVNLGKLAPGQKVGFASRPANLSAAQKFTIQVDRGANMYGN